MAEPRKIKTRVVNKHATAAVWKDKTNFKPLQGEFVIYDQDSSNPTPRIKIGDGSTPVTELPFITAGTADELTTERQISLVGDVQGSIKFDGSADVAMTTELTGTFGSSFDGKASTHDHTFTGDTVDISIPYTPTGSVTGKITPTGSISAPAIKGNLSSNGTLTVTVDAPTFTGNEATITSTFKGDATNLNASITPSGTISEETITPEGTVTTNYNT